MMTIELRRIDDRGLTARTQSRQAGAVATGRVSQIFDAGRRRGVDR